MATVQANTIKLSREIHECCQHLSKTKLEQEQIDLLKKIDDLAFEIFTRPKIILGEADGI